MKNFHQIVYLLTLGKSNELLARGGANASEGQVYMCAPRL